MSAKVNNSTKKTVTDYNIIRNFLRLIFLYSFRTRKDFTECGISLRTYDDLLHRLKNYFDEDLILRKNKKVILKRDFYQQSRNFLVNTYLERTLTPSAYIYVAVMQIISQHKKNGMSRNDIADKIYEMADETNSSDYPDDTNLFILLNELCEYGYIDIKKKNKKGNKYSLHNNAFDTLNLSYIELQNLYQAISFYVNLSPICTPGYYLLDTIKSYVKEKFNKDITFLDCFQYRFNSYSRILDDNINHKILDACVSQNKFNIKLEGITYKTTFSHTIQPAYLLTEYPYNRQFLLNTDKTSFKVESIIDALPNTAEDTQSHQIKNKEKLTTLEFIISFTEPKNNHNRLKIEYRLGKETAWMKKEIIKDNSVKYSSLISDTLKFNYLPWLYTFGSHIELTANCDNDLVKRFISNRNGVLANYGIV